ncbi:MAG: VOC family protein [Spirochaetota bacterium]
MNYCGALIVVEDIKKARYFYETILGQEVAHDYIENVPFKSGFSIHQKSHFEKLIAGKAITMHSNNFELYFEDDDIKGLEERLISHNVEFIHKIVEQPWKQRGMRFYDYDKNIIEVGEKMDYAAYRLFKENMPMEEIMKSLYITREQAEQAIEKYRRA